ncbi:MAG: PIN domain-containing protein [Chloroflexi bacterium]|nr:PIN domain-containing protein [Chloroflexota bacterium]
MRKLFVDTSGWGNYFVRSEPFHYQTRQYLWGSLEYGARIYTSNYVLAELFALLGARFRLSRLYQIELFDALRNADWLTIVYVGKELDDAAWEFCKSRPDKQWSLVDCASFTIMEREQIYFALTEDRHFEQAGFIRLLK